jgi:hypothetical protein
MSERTYTVPNLHNATMTLDAYRDLAASAQDAQQRAVRIPTRESFPEDVRYRIGPGAIVLEDGHDGLPEIEGVVYFSTDDGGGTSADRARIFSTREPETAPAPWWRRWRHQPEPIVRLSVLAIGPEAWPSN